MNLLWELHRVINDQKSGETEKISWGALYHIVLAIHLTSCFFHSFIRSTHTCIEILLCASGIGEIRK